MDRHAKGCIVAMFAIDADIMQRKNLPLAGTMLKRSPITWRVKYVPENVEFTR